MQRSESPPVEVQREPRRSRSCGRLSTPGRPLTYIRSAEEQRIRQLLREAARLVLRRADAGVELESDRRHAPRRRTAAEAERSAACRAGFRRRLAGTGAVPLQGLPRADARFAGDPPATARPLRALLRTRQVRGHLIAGAFHPRGDRAHLVYLEFERPGSGRVGRVPAPRGGAHRGARAARWIPAKTTLHQLARALQGLTLDEARYAIRARAGGRRLARSEVAAALLEEKRLLVNRTGLIEYIADGTSLEDVGGLEGLKKWLLERRKLFQMRESSAPKSCPRACW